MVEEIIITTKGEKAREAIDKFKALGWGVVSATLVITLYSTKFYNLSLFLGFVLFLVMAYAEIVANKRVERKIKSIMIIPFIILAIWVLYLAQNLFDTGRYYSSSFLLYLGIFFIIIVIIYFFKHAGGIGRLRYFRNKIRGKKKLEFKSKKKKHKNKKKYWQRLEHPPKWIKRKRGKLGKRFRGVRIYTGDHYVYKITKSKGKKTKYYRRRKK